MDKKKETWWRSKGVYASACVMLVGVMAAGAVFLREKDMINSDRNMASISTAIPQNDSEDTKKTEEKISVNASKDESMQEKLKEKEEKKEKATASPEATKSASKRKKAEKSAAVNTSQYAFEEEKGLLWPVSGEVIMKYSMSNSVYYKTLAQYKCNPGILIESKVGKSIKSAADGKITKIEKDDEHGMLITADIGNGYSVTYGQAKNIVVKEGDIVKEGQVLGKVAAPTKYFTQEGTNLYFEVSKGEETIDPLLLLR